MHETDRVLLRRELPVFLFPFFHTFNTAFYFQANAMPYSDIAQQIVAKKLENSAYDAAQLETVYDVASTIVIEERYSDHLMNQ